MCLRNAVKGPHWKIFLDAMVVFCPRTEQLEPSDVWAVPAQLGQVWGAPTAWWPPVTYLEQLTYSQLHCKS